MAKVIDSPGGTLNGKAGGLVYYQVGGITYARKAPSKQSKAQKKNVSPIKKLYQNKMAMTQVYLKPLSKLIRFGFQEFEVGARRAYHACVSYTLDNCFSLKDEMFSIDPSLFKFSRGSLMPPQGAKAERVPNGIIFTWQNNSQTSNAKPWDTAFIVLHNLEENLIEYQIIGNSRSTSGQLLPLSDNSLQNKWHAYLGFSQEQSQNGKILLSDSVYLGWI